MSLFLQLTVEAEPHRLGLVRHAVEVWLAAVRWPRPAAEPVVFAVSEVVSNSIEHAYPQVLPGPVTVVLVVEPVGAAHQRVRAVVTDRGRWRAGAPGPTRGNGLQLIRTLCASVEVDTGAGGTRVTLVGGAVARPPGG